MIVTSDWHTHTWEEFSHTIDKDMTDRLMQTLVQIDHVIRLAKSLGDQYVLMLGDVFHRWSAVDTVVGTQFTRMLYKVLEETGIRLIIVPGNHDMNNRRSHNTLTVTPLGGHPQIGIIDQHCVLEIEGMAVAIVPYSRDFKWVQETLRECQSHGGRLAATHIDILKAEAKIHGYHAVQGIPVESFEGYDVSVSGHYHMPQSMALGDTFVHYVGSPLHTHFDDAGQTKRVLRVVDYNVTSIDLPLRAEFIITDRVQEIPTHDCMRYVQLRCRHDQYDELEAYYRPRVAGLTFHPTDRIDVDRKPVISVPGPIIGVDDPTLTFVRRYPQLHQDTLVEMINKYLGEVP